jgi:hypothetical protein
MLSANILRIMKTVSMIVPIAITFFHPTLSARIPQGSASITNIRGLTRVSKLTSVVEGCGVKKLTTSFASGVKTTYTIAPIVFMAAKARRTAQR